MSNAPLFVSLSSARSTTPSLKISMLFTGSLYNSRSNSKFFLCTNLSINRRHPTYLTYCNCNHKADSLDHPHLLISIQLLHAVTRSMAFCIPEGAICHRGCTKPIDPSHSVQQLFCYTLVTLLFLFLKFCCHLQTLLRRSNA